MCVCVDACKWGIYVRKRCACVCTCARPRACILENWLRRRWLARIDMVMGSVPVAGDHISRAAPSCHCPLPTALCEIGPFHFVYQFVSHAGKRSLNGLIYNIYIYYIMYTCLYTCRVRVDRGMWWSVLLLPFNFTQDTDKINTFFPTLCHCHHHHGKPIRTALTRVRRPAISTVGIFHDICIR